ncbi:MAG: hypothetical protein F9K45_03445, partial [Melioribacteraceae bacterium]
PQNTWWGKREINITLNKEFISERYSNKNAELKNRLYSKQQNSERGKQLTFQKSSFNNISATTAITGAERNILIELYNSTDGDNWNDNTGWKTPPLDTDGFAMPGTENTWFGITIVADKVVEIDLNNNSLSGNIPEELGDLQFLTYLDLSYNNFPGSIPAGIADPGDLPSLEILYLISCGLSGSIPDEIGNLTNLIELDLSDNGLGGSIPSSFGNLNLLESLFLPFNNLSGSIPSELGDMSSLKELVLYNNNLSGTLPPAMFEPGDLPNLIGLDISVNNLTGSLPAEISNLTILEYLYLSQNQLTGNIPGELGDLNQLLELDLYSNELSGTIPLGMMDPGDLPIIYFMDLSLNGISGTIPAEIENLSSLGELYLSGNKLTGAIPDEFMNLVHLIATDLSWNALYTNNAVLKAFIDAVTCVCGWEDTQTIAPENIAAYEANQYSIITWTPIDYTVDDGGYDIYLSSFSGGPYNYLGSVNDKNSSEYSLAALGQDFSYYFVVRARTDPHANNNNIIHSENSSEILITNNNAIYPPEIVRNTGATINEGDTFVFSDLVLRSDDADSDVFQLLYTVVRKPENGLLLVNNFEASTFTQNDIANGKVSYKHDGGNSQTDYFTFYVSDTDGLQTEGRNFIFTINNINDPPVVDSFPKIIMNEDEPYSLNVADWYEYISDPDDDYNSLIFSISNNDNYVSVEKNSDSTFTIIPKANYYGASSLTVVIKDKSDSVSTNVEIEIMTVNDLPVIKNLIPVFAFSNGKTAILNLSSIATDAETPDSLLIYTFYFEPDSLLINYDSKTGKLSLNAKGNFTGDVDLIVRIEDENGGQTEGKVAIKVLPSQLTDINENKLPEDFALYQNYPNPFNPSTLISYSI